MIGAMNENEQFRNWIPLLCNSTKLERIHKGYSSDGKYIVHDSEVSVPFSVGQIQGYNHYSEPDDEFWQLYSLYLAMTLISSVVWVLKVKPDELDLMLMKIHKVMDDHNNFELTVPKWYSQYQVNV